MSAAVLCVLLCLIAVTVAADSRAVPPAERRGGDGMAILRRAVELDDGLHYAGVRSLSWRDSAGRTETTLLHVLHRPEVGTLVRPVRETGGGTDVLVGSGAWGDPDGAVLAVLESNFWVDADGAEKVGERSALRVTARRDNGQLAARFWVDEATGLLLRREVYDTDGELAQAGVFESIRFGADAVAAADDTAQSDTTVVSRPWGDELDERELDLLRSDGWALPEQLPWGFTLVEARSTGSGSNRVTHLTYSDGICVISVFTQRGSLGAGAVSGLRAVEEDGALVHVADEGGQHQRMWEADGFVHTVLADAPEGIVSGALRTLPPPDGTGFWARVGRGLDRMGTWLE
ncbi:sigma-E factor regulatory protein RseB domain-containing protein [Thermobifida halotolerans]|uniref:sigma-E factor regulatory protein RseB domain-containing protein n=1 Tax=Thermobifida halotolerans TaxID=483545 RepID=UPI001FB24A69|nr:sigma-E factor regulatory protein RseB domain-containing protein [Thermobifida halotolerans]